MDWPSENIRRFKAGQTIVNEGDIGREMFIVLNGQLHVTKRGTAGEKVISILNRGDFFGEMAILEDLPRSANVVAVTDSELLEINAAKADEMLARQPEIAMRMLKKMSERLREADRQIETLLHNSDPSRIVHTISSLVYLHGRQLDGQWVLDRNLDKAQLSALAGVSEQAAEKVMKDLTKNRLVDFGAECTVIHNRESLDNFLQYLKWRNMAFAP